MHPARRPARPTSRQFLVGKIDRVDGRVQRRSERAVELENAHKARPHWGGWDDCTRVPYASARVRVHRTTPCPRVQAIVGKLALDDFVIKPIEKPKD